MELFNPFDRKGHGETVAKLGEIYILEASRICTELNVRCCLIHPLVADYSMVDQHLPLPTT